MALRTQTLDGDCLGLHFSPFHSSFSDHGQGLYPLCIHFHRLKEGVNDGIHLRGLFCRLSEVVTLKQVWRCLAHTCVSVGSWKIHRKGKELRGGGR